MAAGDRDEARTNRGSDRFAKAIALLALVVAAYGAVVSTKVASNQITATDIQLTKRVVVEPTYQSPTRCSHDDVMGIQITNTSPRPITINHVLFVGKPSRNQLGFIQDPPQAAPPTQDATLRTLPPANALPHRLGDGDTMKLWYPVDELKRAVPTLQHVTVRDAEGRGHDSVGFLSTFLTLGAFRSRNDLVGCLGRATLP